MEGYWWNRYDKEIKICSLSFLIFLIIELLFIGSNSVMAQKRSAFIIVNQTYPACTIGSSYTTTIQGAINIANAGDTIIVCPGLYRENIVINTPSVVVKSYIGPSNTTIDASVAGNVLEIRNNNVTIDGFTVTGASSGQTTGIQLWVTGSSTIKHNIISGNYYGIRINSGGGHKVLDNYVKNGMYAVIIEAGSSGNIVKDNTIAASGWAVGIWQSTYNLLTDNNITAPSIIVYDSRYNNFTGNRMRLDSFEFWNTFSGGGNYIYNTEL